MEQLPSEENVRRYVVDCPSATYEARRWSSKVHTARQNIANSKRRILDNLDLNADEISPWLTCDAPWGTLEWAYCNLVRMARHGVMKSHSGKTAKC
jgi:hypothetical protein